MIRFKTGKDNGSDASTAIIESPPVTDTDLQSFFGNPSYSGNYFIYFGCYYFF